MARTPTPQRVAHLLPPSFLAELLSPSYANANNREAGEVYDEVKTGLEGGRLRGPLCDALWIALQDTHPDMDETALLEHLAQHLAKRGRRPVGAPQSALDSMMPLFAAIDLQVGRASDATRVALENPNGQKLLAKALNATAQFLVKRWR